ncbi:hypothetical protein ABID22_003596 [Pontibacter aydingkolensis]|uniref:Collagen triple helix repeat-containing protein n=1 Tax=Pontibacter aydingkolensis TaxID=1911536 RepID=A0ABS7CYF4_9BACT|nr:hypothetical protein [Pontibacter aydingkolensis]MBW7468857.1 hypothetical protein [Pontibacter aydingkolensis]
MKTLLQLKTALAAVATWLCFAPASAQSIIPKLEIKKNQVYIADSTNTIRVDTLIMHDKATIQFDPGKYGVLEARVAIIGDKCIVSSKGKDGKRSVGTVGRSTGPDPGEDGENGGNLSIALHLEKLGKLTIDTRGGDGGPGINGVNGKTGTPDRRETQTYKDASGKLQTVTVTVPGETGTDGSDATRGGNGGHGGNLMFMYSTNGLIPVFNHSQRNTNSIVILSTGGRNGSNGEPGKGGYNARNGDVRDSGLRDSLDGRLDLVNLNMKAN